MALRSPSLSTDVLSVAGLNLVRGRLPPVGRGRRADHPRGQARYPEAIKCVLAIIQKQYRSAVVPSGSPSGACRLENRKVENIEELEEKSEIILPATRCSTEPKQLAQMRDVQLMSDLVQIVLSKSLEI
eukprot:6207482-Pleurochrysis_carterae.AAC.1